MNGKSLQVVLSSLIVFGAVGISPASIVVDQPPAQLGGSGSDTLGRDFFGEEIWQRAADNIVLNSNAVVGGVNWWGFYGSDDLPHVPPVGNEVFRVRFYSARPNGLPDESSILYEESILNPLRTSTGRTIAVQGRPDEYLYEVALAHPVALSMSQLYWLEIAQVGDVESWFRWETGFGEVPQHALINYLVTDWRISSGSYAFQLVAVPEPGTAALCSIGCSVLLGLVRNLRRSRALQDR